jgi:hypothetical protein
MKKFEYTRHSPSALSKFAASPSAFVLEKVIGVRSPAGAKMILGNAVEDGVTLGLMDKTATVDDCIATAEKRYREVPLLGDPERENCLANIPGMVTNALAELRPYVDTCGPPSHTQGEIIWHPQEIKYPIYGKYDYHWADRNITVDLKTTGAMPSSIRTDHARQVAFYAGGGNADGRVTYVTAKKHVTYQVENIDAHRADILKLAVACEAFLALSDDPQDFLRFTVPNLDHNYLWKGPARDLARKYWGI